MQIETSRFGHLEQVEVPGDRLLRFPAGLIGFERLRMFARLDDEQHGPFGWLQSLEDVSVCFVVTSPSLFFPDYSFDVSDEDVSALGLHAAEDAEALVIVVMRPNPEDITANLMAPVVINIRTQVARQIVLSDSAFLVRTPLLPPISFSRAAGGG